MSSRPHHLITACDQRVTEGSKALILSQLAQTNALARGSTG